MRLKICGLTREEDIDAVNRARPDYAGFVFAPSRRQVSPQQAIPLRKRLAPGILPVGVFVNAEIDFIERLYDNGVIKLAQLHGDEDEAYIRLLRRVCPVPVIKMMRPGALCETQADFILLDSGAGSGVPFDWSLLPPIERPWFLAGGISLENLDEAIALRPWGIDISSGAETDGRKDPEKVLKITEKVRQCT